MDSSKQISPAATLPDSADVVIVGGGPVGSALAIELGLRGIKPLILERRDEIQTQGVRARNMSVRTLELCRKWGIVDEFRGAKTLPDEWHRGMIVRTRMAGFDLCEPIGAGRPTWSPAADWKQIASEGPQDLPQYEVNRVFRERAIALGADLRTGFEVEGLTQDEDKVTLSVRSKADGSTSELKARYVIGCDGGRSIVRGAVGIEQIETEPVGRFFNFVFRFPDAFEQLGIEPGVLFFIYNRETNGLISPYDGDLWRVGIGPVPVDRDPGEFDLIAETQKFMGLDVEIEAIHCTTHLVQKKVVETRHRGRVLLAGDAAQAFPPHLGQNLNTGVADAVTLGWTLAGVIQGWAGPGVLEAYSLERNSVAHMLADASLAIEAGSTEIANSIGDIKELEVDDEAGAAARAGVGRRINAVLGGGADGLLFDHRLDDSPIVVTDERKGPAFDPGTYQPSSAPGHRAPHVWLAPDDPLSDHFGLWFTLLVQQAEPGEVQILAAAAGEAGVPLEVLSVAHPAVAELYTDRLTVIRPDRVVAWRGNAAPANPAELFDKIRAAERQAVAA